MSRHYPSNGSISSGSSSDHAHSSNGASEKIDTLLSTGQIPIIDLAHSGTDQRPSRTVVLRVAAQLHKALASKGVVFLVNHGICEEMMQRAWSYLDQFCDLPGDTQEAYIRPADNSNNHGYIRPGQERFDGDAGGDLAATTTTASKKKTTGGGRQELRHAFNICTLSGSSLPEEPLPGFRANVAELAGEFKSLSALLLQALAIGLSVEPDFFVGQHTHMMSGNADNETTLRLLYYPPVVEDDNKCELVRGQCQYMQQHCAKDRLDLRLPDDDNDNDDDEAGVPKVMRCGTHCDYGTFTLLAQDSEGGLEVRLPGCERWQRVGHLPGAILMNTGELLALWTAQQYPALLHRVIVPPQRSIRSRGRHSMAFFCHPDNCTAVQPLAELEAQALALANGCGGAAGGGVPCARKPSFKLAKEKVASAYQMIQRKFRKTYNGGNGNGNDADA